MEELFGIILGGILRAIVFIGLEMLVYQVFYYVGAVPVWVVSAGRLPTRNPVDLPRRDRFSYGLIGILFTVLMGVIYFSMVD